MLHLLLHHGLLLHHAGLLIHLLLHGLLLLHHAWLHLAGLLHLILLLVLLLLVGVLTRVVGRHWLTGDRLAHLRLLGLDIHSGYSSIRVAIGP